jgi:hypothetical protein
MKNSSVDRERESHDLLVAVVAVAGSLRMDISIWKRFVKENVNLTIIKNI